MKAVDRHSNMAGFMAVFLAVGTVLASRFSFSFSAEEVRLYVVLMISYIWIGILILYARKFYDLYVFEPLSFVSAIYIAVFIVKPLIDLRAKHMIEHGVDVSGGGVKATLILLLGYTCLYIGYYLTYDASNMNVLENLPLVEETPEYEPLSLYLVWGFSFSMCLLCMFSQGLSIRYIFTLGKVGEVTVSESNTALLFLSNFVVVMISSWMLILFRTKNTAGKVVITILEIIYLIMRNSRWLMLVLMLSPITYYFVKRRRRPRGLYLMLVGLSGLVIFAWMQANRGILATGGAVQGWGEEGLTLAKLAAPFESDLNTYRAFFSMVTRFPSRYGCLMGVSYLYIFILFIPRALWKGKPDNPIRAIIEHSLNGRARISGTAVSNIGEIYANFGVFGCAFVMFLIGRILAWLKTFYQGYRDDDLILYSVMYPLLFQWTARGNFSGNFYVTIFALLPFFFKKYLLRKTRLQAGRDQKNGNTEVRDAGRIERSRAGAAQRIHTDL